MDSKYGFAGNHGSSKTSLSANNNAGIATKQPGTVVNESVDDLPLPPHPASSTANPNNAPLSSTVASNSASSRYAILPQQTQNGSSKRSQSQPPTDAQGNVPELPKVPPKIDRQKKPSRRSATERLFGNGEVSGNYMNSESNSNGNASSGLSSIPHTQSMANSNRASHHPHSSSSLDRHTHIRDMKMVRISYSLTNSINWPITLGFSAIIKY